jgi:hypothetical protein
VAGHTQGEGSGLFVLCSMIQTYVCQERRGLCIKPSWAPPSYKAGPARRFILSPLQANNTLCLLAGAPDRGSGLLKFRELWSDNFLKLSMKAGCGVMTNAYRGMWWDAWCEHVHPIEVHLYENGRRARCLHCGAYGPLRGDAVSARWALIVKGIEVNQTT